MKNGNEPNDDDLLLYYYDEAPEAEEIRQRLEASPELRERYEALCRDLRLAEAAMAPPERSETYGAELWSRLQSRLAEAEASPPEAGRLLPWLQPSEPIAKRRERLPVKRWGMAAAAMLLLGVGFFAGHSWRDGQRPKPAPLAAATVLSAPARERILTHAVAAHFERSERLFTELANAPLEGTVDIGAERRWARDLLDANRLYRQSTSQGARQGETARLAPLLDELEPFLLDLSHGPDEISSGELTDLRRRFEERALLFKLRVAGTSLAGSQTL